MTGFALVINNASPLILSTDDDGVTTGPVTVNYQVFATPDTIGNASVHLDRDGVALTSVGMRDLTPGVHTLTIPAGVNLNTPAERVQISLENLPALTVSVSNRRPTPTTGAGATLIQAKLDGVSPGSVIAGAATTRITLTGENLSGMSRLYARRSGGEWVEVSLVNQDKQTNTSAAADLPAALLATGGMLRLAARNDALGADSIAFLVAQPGLPAPGTATELTVNAVSLSDLGDGATTLQLTGAGFSDGVTVWLGRNGQFGEQLAVTDVGDGFVQANLPGVFVGKGEDLELSVRSADGSRLSEVLPIASSRLDTGDPASMFSSDVPGITGFDATLRWNVQGQVITIRGVRLANGMTVRFTSRRASHAIDAVALTYGAHVVSTEASGTQIVEVSVKVPPEVTAYPVTALVATADIVNVSQPVNSTPFFLAPQEPLEIPLGGRVRVVVMRDPQTGNLHILKADSQTGAPTTRPTGLDVAGRLQAVPDANVLLASNPQAPLATGESSPTLRLERGSIYVRGLRLSTDPVTLQNRGQGAVGASSGAKTTQQPVNVVHLSGDEWPTNHDQDILAAADAYDIPFQFLKAQIFFESAFRDRSYRYESMTVDLLKLTGDGTLREGAHKGVLDGQTRWIDQTPFKWYRIATDVLASTDPTIAPVVISGADYVGETEINVPLHAPMGIRSREGLSTRNQPGVKVSRTPNAKPALTQKESTAVWRKDKGVVAPTLTSRDFSIDYVTGKLKLGSPLQANEQLTITFVPITIEANYDDGKFRAGTFSPDTDPSGDLALRFGTRMSPGETIADFFKENRDVNSNGGFLARSSGEYQIEFDNATNIPIDNRLSRVKAQYYAAASYGPLQLLLSQWTGQRGNILKRVYDIGDQPAYALSKSQYRKGVELGALVHRINETNAALNCAANGNDKAAWEQCWAAVFAQYNTEGPHYKADKSGLSDIIIFGRDLEVPAH